MFLKNQGFTVLEILLVVTAIGILAGVVIIALNPTKQIENTRDVQRQNDANNILNSVYQFALDNNGLFPVGIDSTVDSSQVLGTASAGCDTTCGATTTVASCLDLGIDLISGYIEDIPTDPSTGTSANTDYYINRLANGRVVVGACDAEQSATIEVTR